MENKLIINGGHKLFGQVSVGGDVTLYGAIAEHNESLISFLKQTACQISVNNDKINVKSDGRLSSISSIQTMPYPFFSTDLQPQIMVLQSLSCGTCLLTENVFESRFGLVPELKKMGADISVQNGTAIIRGVEKLYGADVFATDLCAGAALVMAGLAAEGYTTEYNVEYIDREYERIEEKFKILGADIQRN